MWLTIFYNESHTVISNQWVTSTSAVWSRGHGQFLTSHRLCSSKYGTYLSDHHSDKLLKGHVSDPFLQCGSGSGHVRQTQELEIV